MRMNAKLQLRSGYVSNEARSINLTHHPYYRHHYILFLAEFFRASFVAANLRDLYT